MHVGDAPAAPEQSVEQSEEQSVKHRNGRRKQRMHSQIDEALQCEFERLWISYPARNGKRVGKPEALRKYLQLSPEERALLPSAVQNFARSEFVGKGIGIKDFHRFLQNGHGDQPWREWLVPEQPARRNALVCTKRIHRDGDPFLRPCGRPATPESRGTEPRCEAHLVRQPAEVAAAL